MLAQASIALVPEVTATRPECDEPFARRMADDLVEEVWVEPWVEPAFLLLRRGLGLGLGLGRRQENGPGGGLLLCRRWRGPGICRGG